MWETFLNRTSQSVAGLPTYPNFYRQKLDINSVEYQSYIHKSVLSVLDRYPMSNKAPQQPVKKNTIKRAESPVSYSNINASKSAFGSKAQSGKSTGDNHKKFPVYLKIAIKDVGYQDLAKNKPASKPHSEVGSSCRTEPRTPRTYRKSSPTLGKFAENKAEDKITCVCSKEKDKLNLESKEEKIVKSRKEKKLPVLKINKKVKCVPIKENRDSLLGAKKDMYRIGSYKVFKFGEKGSGTRSRGGQQDFYRLRDECLERGELFEDPEFPATDSSLFFSQRPDRYYEWKRPSEICEDPQLFVEGFSRFDVQQGELGDCWLLAATANLTLYRRLFFQIVPDDQGFDEKYAGIFHFRFWQYGKWIDVVIDDRLPTYRGQLIFLHSTEDNEFWSALLEKAYAKLHGSYEALKGGSTCEAMEDFTGGVTEMYEMEACPPNLFQIMLKAYERASLMGCSIEPDPNVVEAQTPEGLVRGHAYSITRVQHVDIQTPNVTGKIPLLRLRNPWGNESEWNGPWSDGAPEWRFIGDAEKEELGLTFDNDGEFWMSFKDFQQHFSRVEICNLNPDSLSEEELREGNKKKWEMSVFEGEWVRGVTAGGCRNFLESFWRNPQYRVTLTEVDEGDDDGNCTMIVALMQKNRRQIRSTGADLLTVGFAIYHLPQPDQVPKPLDLQFFKYNASVARSPSFINLREVSCRFKLPPGTYAIVPSTFDPNEEGEFLLRVFSENQNNMEYDGYNASANARAEDNEVSDDDAPSYPAPQPPRPTYPGYPESSGYPPQPQSPGGYPGYPGGYPQSGYPGGYPQSPQGGYPYPQPAYGQNPYPNYPGYPQPSHPQYPGYPGYSSDGGSGGYQQPQPPPRSSRGGDPIMNFFNKLFK